MASECVPFAKAGGLGDVVGALPKALMSLGHDVRVLMPKYGALKGAEGFAKHPDPLGVPMGAEAAWCAVHGGYLPGSEVPVYLLEHEAAFAGPSIYGGEDGTTWGAFKYGLLSRAAFELSRWLNWPFDILHVHDWHTAWASVMANEVEPGPRATVLTIHNMAHQPKFPAASLTQLGLGYGAFRTDGLEDFGAVNPFKGGLYHATMLTTVSPTYAHEIRSPAFGCGLHSVTEFRGADLVGILNGIDDEVWDPSKDSFLPAHYDVGDLAGKSTCKQHLEGELGLTPQRDGPLLGVVSRMTAQKGLDVVADSVPRLLEEGARLALLGSGDPVLEARFRSLAEAFPGRVGVRIGYSEALAHLIEAGSDFFLMPSRFEPCGLNQLYSQRYGTMPIVHATGGLDDTVQQCDPSQGTGTGFKMYSLSVDALVNTTRWALEVYREAPDLLRAMQRQSMTKRMGWNEAAPRYEEVYRWSLERKGLVADG